MIVKKLRTKQHGFTILELLIATTVFSTILLLATSGIIHIGKVYYRGIINAKTQETARSIVDEVSKSIQMGGTNDIIAPDSPRAGNIGPNGEKAFCVGNIRYTFAPNTKLLQTSVRNSQVLWVDQTSSNPSCLPLNLNSTSSCSAPTVSPPCDAETDKIADAKRRELLSNNMRVANLQVDAITGSLARINLTIVYGDNESLLDPSNPSRGCRPIKEGGQFCSIASIETFVKKRL